MASPKVLLCLILLSLAVPLLAFQMPDLAAERAALNLELPGERTATVYPPLTDLARLETLRAALGESWRGVVNPETGSLHRAWGASLPLAGLSGADDEAFIATARELIDGWPELIGVSSSNLSLIELRRQGGKVSVFFDQTRDGMRLMDARVFLLFHESGRLMAFGSDVHAGLAPPEAITLDAATAMAIAASSIGFTPPADSEVLAEARLLALEGKLVPVWRTIHRVASPPGNWETLVDARNGEVLSRRDRICFADVLGEVKGDVHWTGYCDGDQADTPFANQRVTAVFVGTTHTDAEGGFAIPHDGSDPVNVTAGLDGLWLDVDVMYGDEASFSQDFTPGTPGLVYWDDVNARDDEVDTWVHSNRIHDYMKDLDPGFTGLDYVMPCMVGRDDEYCPGNAWWDYTGVNYCEGTDTYANTGEIGDIIYHEYGHGITTFVYGGEVGGQPSGAIHEGNSDVTANLMTGYPEIAVGYYTGNCDSHIRNSDNDLMYPDDMNGGGHHDGQILAGFYWDTYQLLIGEYGEEGARDLIATAWHDGRMLGMPWDFPDQVWWTFVGDDDDGDLDNGTPHYDAFCEGALNHGFDCPFIPLGVLFSHTPLSETDETENPLPVAADIWSTEAMIDSSTTTVFWRSNGGDWQAELLSHVGGNTFAGALPPQETGHVEYYLYAEDTAGNVATYPYTVPLDYFDFLVAWLIDDMEMESGWTVGHPSDNADGGIWERVDPIGTIAQPDDDHSAAGTLCWLTGQHTPGEADDFNDVDNGYTTLMTPVFNLEGADSVQIRYWRWYSNSEGDSPNVDWWKVYISNNGGAGWTYLESTQTSSNEWVSRTFALADFFATPGQLQIKFVASDLGYDSLIEAAVDDLAILAEFDLTGAEDGLSIAFAPTLAQNHPNPFNPSTEIHFSLKSAEAVNLSVYDASGRLVRVLAQGRLHAGDHVCRWDGRDLTGRPTASGAYFLRLSAGENRLQRKMMLLK